MSGLLLANNRKLKQIKIDPRVLLFKAAFDHQSGANFDFPIFAGRNQFGQGFAFPVIAGRNQYDQGYGGVLSDIWHFFCFVVLKGANTLLKAESEAIKKGRDGKGRAKSDSQVNDQHRAMRYR